MVNKTGLDQSIQPVEPKTDQVNGLKTALNYFWNRTQKNLSNPVGL